MWELIKVPLGTIVGILGIFSIGFGLGFVQGIRTLLKADETMNPQGKDSAEPVEVLIKRGNKIEVLQWGKGENKNAK